MNDQIRRTQGTNPIKRTQSNQNNIHVTLPSVCSGKSFFGSVISVDLELLGSIHAGGPWRSLSQIAGSGHDRPDQMCARHARTTESEPQKKAKVNIYMYMYMYMYVYPRHEGIFLHTCTCIECSWVL